MVITQYIQGILSLAGKTFVILLLVFLLLELIQRSGLLNKSIQTLGKLISFLGYKKESSAPLLAGIILGIIYGAGVIDDSIKREGVDPALQKSQKDFNGTRLKGIKKGGVDKKQVLLVSVFLSMCHAIFEDTGLFLVLGANLFWITVPRIFLAFIITFITSKLLSLNHRVTEE